MECKVALPTPARTKSAAGKAQKSKKSGSNVWVIAALSAASTVGLLVVALQFIQRTGEPRQRADQDPNR